MMEPCRQSISEAYDQLEKCSSLNRLTHRTCNPSRRNNWEEEHVDLLLFLLFTDELGSGTGYKCTPRSVSFASSGYKTI